MSCRSLPEKWDEEMEINSRLAHRLLDTCWDCCKDFIPNSVHTKNAKNKFLNAEIWNEWTMCINGSGDTITAMPSGRWCQKFWKNLTHDMWDLQMWEVEKQRVLYGRRHLVYLCDISLKFCWFKTGFTTSLLWIKLLCIVPLLHLWTSGHHR